jgi:hypothetical protein
VRELVEDAGFELEQTELKSSCCTTGRKFHIDDDANIMNPATVER